MADLVLRVAVPSPLRRLFDYLPPADCLAPPPGVRVRVPFGGTTRVGIVLECAAGSDIEAGKLRPALGVLDARPLLPARSLAFLRWASEYFHHPIGEVVVGTLPRALRQGKSPRLPAERWWVLTREGVEAARAPPGRAPRQHAVLKRLADNPRGLGDAGLRARNSVLQALERKGWIRAAPPPRRDAAGDVEPPPLRLNREQRAAVEAIQRTADRFQVHLLDGVTGSGKTEVYLALIERSIAMGRQALVLVPEIGLTPQTVARFEARLGAPVGVWHSGLTDRQRLTAWIRARDGTAPVIIGTRSAVFVPVAKPGLFIVDEEHDLAFKQQDGFRYSARDLAVVRARQDGVPAILGSATPSLESVHNVFRDRYREHVLPVRAGESNPPRIDIIDVRARPFDEGLSAELVTGLEVCLQAGKQALLFVNRRGFAPIWICHDCGWTAECARCDARLVYHRQDDKLCCHHCGSQQPALSACPACGGGDLRALGLGTQRVVRALQARFPDAAIDRMDRDNTRRKGALEAILARIHSGETDVLVGTQMVAKGHHFPNVTLVGILDADGGLFGVDFRAAERMSQLLIQVAGRAGRGSQTGRVLVQTHHPGHQLLRTLIREGYRSFSREALREREQAHLPPFSHLALLRSEAPTQEAGTEFLAEARRMLLAAHPRGLEVLGPVSAPMERRAGRYRAQLLIDADSRGELHSALAAWAPKLEELKSGRRVRWSLDVDPQELV